MASAWQRGTHALRADPYIGPLVARYGALQHLPNKRYFQSLLFAIVSQQISTKAALSIKKRIELHFGRPLTPAKIASGGPLVLRELGLSGMKAAYVTDLAQKFSDRTISPRTFHALSDEQVIAKLVQVKGIGRWTAEMFLIFSLDRVDVFPVDDYGIQKAVQQQLSLAEVPKGKALAAIGEQWAPWRSVATLYLWKSLNSPVIKTVKN